jgi:hypothetical protein
MTTRRNFSVFSDSYLLILVIFIWGQFSLAAQPGYNQVYTGQRLSMYGIKVTDQTEKSFSFKYQIVNTGREAIALGKKVDKLSALVIEFDTVNVPLFLHEHFPAIAEAVLLEKISLKPGESLPNETLKIIKNKQNKPEKTPRIKETPTPEKKPVENIEPVVVVDNLPTSETKPKKPSKSDAKPKEKSEPVVIADPLPTSETKPKKPNKEVEKPKEQTKQQQPVKISAQDTEVLVNEKSFENEPMKNCADLVFDTVYIVKQRKNSMVLHFTLRNIGDATAQLLGSSGAKEDNIAVNVYMTSGLKLTRGSFLADGIFFKDKSTDGGKLFPGKLLEGEIEINTENRTRFTPNLVFELDPFQTVQECNKTNNTKGIIVKD